MKRLFTVVAIITAALSFGQEPIEKTVGEFREVKVYDLIEVKMIKSDINKVVISGKNTEDVVTVNKNGKLKIRMNLEEIFDGNRTSVHLYYTNVDIIDANEGSFIHSDDTIEQFEIDLKTQEGGHIKVDLNVKFANIKANSGGKVEATGTSLSQDIVLSTGGVYKGEDLDTENTTVRIKAAGEAYVKASDLVDIKIRAGGDVFVYGDPKTIKENRVFGGRVKRMD
jgi:hypothetical protein